MLRIRYVLLFGILLGGISSVAVIKGRGHYKRVDSKTKATETSGSRRPSGY